MKSISTTFALLALAGYALAAPALLAPVELEEPITNALSARAVDSSYKATVLRHHNVHRANHSVDAFTWGGHMFEYAQDWASKCVWGHNMTYGTYGQNIAAGTKPADIAEVITDEFYNGEVNWFSNLYGQQSPSTANLEHWGHFSQVVWKDSRHVGCYTKDCSATGIKGLEGTGVAPYMTVCNYWPPGNYLGEFADNVKKPLGKATVYENY